MLDDRFNIEQAEYYLDRMFGKREGYVAMAFGHNPRTSKPRFAKGDMRSHYYAWPADKELLLEEVDDVLNHPSTRNENVEIFICPALRKTPSRLQGTHAPLRWVWADLDHSPTDQQIERINGLGSMTVLSGTEGHRHVYIPLDKPVSAATHQAMCRALRDAIGADSKIAENDLLRLPGTLNWKTTQPNNVWLKSVGRQPQAAKWIVDLLVDMTSTDWSHYKNQAAEAHSDANTGDIPDNHPAPSRKSLPPDVRKAFDYQPDPGKRNQAIFQLIATCKEQGLSREDTHALAWSYPPAVSKWNQPWRISNDVDRIWQKSAGPAIESAITILDEDDDGTDQPRLIFHTWATLRARVANAPAPKYLFEGIISEGDYGIISAEDKAGKSLVMLDAAVSAASSTPWMDKFKTITDGPVVVCVGEGSERKQVRRIEAICRQKGLTDEQISHLPLHILLGVPQVRDEEQIEELEKTIREVKPVLVLIDPFYLAAGGVDFAKLSDVGQALQPIQHVCQRYNAALMLSHHWNKTGNGDSIARTSGVGLTAWGRFLIGIKIEKESMDPVTRKTTVLQTWSIKGDEVMTEDFSVERTVWVDDPTDLTSPMHYELTLADGEQVKRAKPLRNPATMEKISAILEENLDGLGIRGLMRAMLEKYGANLNTKTAGVCLDQLVLHGYITEGRAVGRGKIKPYLHIKAFLRAEHEASEPADNRPGLKPATSRVMDLDAPRPRRRRPSMV